VALSIQNHRNFEKQGYTEYLVDVWSCSQLRVISKRYSDFVALSKALKKENGGHSKHMPHLPKKRWFQAQRWVNKFDETYALNRRKALEAYLRDLLRTEHLLESSRAFKGFLELSLVVPAPSSSPSSSSSSSSKMIPIGTAGSEETSRTTFSTRESDGQFIVVAGGAATGTSANSSGSSSGAGGENGGNRRSLGFASVFGGVARALGGSRDVGSDSEEDDSGSDGDGDDAEQTSSARRASPGSKWRKSDERFISSFMDLDQLDVDVSVGYEGDGVGGSGGGGAYQEDDDESDYDEADVGRMSVLVGGDDSDDEQNSHGKPADGTSR
jgi:PX domain